MAARNHPPDALDLQKRMDIKGSISPIVEILTQTNDILDDAVWIECNNGTAHKTTMRTGIPGPPSASSTAASSLQVPHCSDHGQLRHDGELRRDRQALADLNGNARPRGVCLKRRPSSRASPEALPLHVLRQRGPPSPKASPASPALQHHHGRGEQGQHLLRLRDRRGLNCTSIGWSCGDRTPSTCSTPRARRLACWSRNKGQVTIENLNGDGGRMEAYRTHYRWDAGMTVRDWRYVSRIQIATSILTNDGATGPKLTDWLATALEMIPNINAGRAAFYCNRTVRGYFRRQIANKVNNSTLSIEQITRPNGALVHMPTFDGIPIRRCDALTNTETVIS